MTKSKQHNFSDIEEIYKLCFPEKSFSDQVKIFTILGAHLYVLKNENDIFSSFIIWQQISDDAFEILDIGTHPKFRNQGLAAKILSKLCAKLKTGSELMLEVRADNKTAIGLYQKSGFIKNGLREKYYTTNNGRIDAVLMQKII